MNNSKALIPISVDSKRFSTNEVIFALNSISTKHKKIVFLIADGLQLYNKATQVEGGKKIKNIIETFNLRNNYHNERVKWLLQIKSKLFPTISEMSWDFKDMYSISDSEFHKIYRNVVVSYLTIKDFSEDIKLTAVAHCLKVSKNYSELDLNLSIEYILEEIAANLRIRVLGKITTEYYLGELPLPLINLYQNKYEVDVFTLCGKEINHHAKFEFYHSPDQAFINWVSATD